MNKRIAKCVLGRLRIENENFKLSYNDSLSSDDCYALSSKELERIGFDGSVDDEIEKLKIEARLNLLDEGCFEFLKEDKRACFFIWCLFYEMKLDVNKSRSEMDLFGDLLHRYDAINVIKYINEFCEHRERYLFLKLKGARHDTRRVGGIYDYHKVKHSSLSHKERYENILDVFDLSIWSLDEKKDILSSLVTMYDVFRKEMGNMDWLNATNNDCVAWAYEYIAKTDVYVNYLRPFGYCEKYLSVLVSLDMWCAHPAEKKDFINKMKGSWRQKQYRKGNSDKRLINTYISNDAKVMLDEMVERAETTIGNMLERVIKEKYDKIVS